MHARLLPVIPPDAPIPTARSRSAARSLLIGLAAGVAMGALIGLGAKALDSTLLRDLFGGYRAAGLWTLALLVLALLGAIFVHEMGHVLGGLAVRFKFVLFVVGPLRVERESTGALKVSLNKELASGGGLAAMFPEDQRDLARRFAWVVAGGPLCSLVTGLLLIPLIAVLPDPGVGRAFVATLAAMSLVLAVATMLPMTAGVYLNDGARLLQLRRGGAPAERDAAMLSLLAASSADVPFESWEHATVLASIEPVDGSIFELQGRSNAYAWALARGATDEARAQLQRAIDISAGLPPLMRAALDNEMAFMHAIHPTTDGAGATALQAPTGIPGLPEYARLRTIGAIAAAQGDTAAARVHVEAAREQLMNGKVGATGAGKWELDRLREVEARLV